MSNYRHDVCVDGFLQLSDLEVLEKGKLGHASDGDDYVEGVDVVLGLESRI